MNYTELQNDIASWTHRDDLTDAIPECIARAENIIFRELALRNTETSTSGTTSGATINFPADFGNIVRIKLIDSGVEHTIDYTSPNGIEYLTASTGLPSRFIVQDDVITLIPAPSGSYSYTVYYTPLLAALSDANTTNWLSINHTDVYLNGALVEVAKWTKDDAMLNRFMPAFTNSIEAVRRADERKRFPTSGGLQIKTRCAR